MITTNKFMVLNMPKTGTTFVRDIIKKLHPVSFVDKILFFLGMRKPPYHEFILPKIYASKGDYKQMKDQHGVFIQIPEAHKKKAVLSVARSPFSKLISMYEFGFWQRRPVTDPAILKKQFPSFPDLSFAEYLEMHFHYNVEQLAGKQGLLLDLGPQSIMHIKFYAKDPEKTLRELKSDFNLNSHQDEFADIHFIHTENLNQELYDYLETCGYSKEDLAFIKEMPKKNTSKRSKSTYFTPEIRELVIHKERLLFQLFPEYLDDKLY